MSRQEMNGGLVALGVIAAMAAVGARSGSRATGDLHKNRDSEPVSLEEGMSPLTYPRSAGVRRISLVDRTAPPAAPGEMYFAPGDYKSTGRKKVFIPGAAPGVVAFLDYHILPGTGSGDSTDAVYIDFYTVRRDMRGRGLGRRIIEEFYLLHADAKWIDWGEVVSDAAAATWRRMKADPGVPPTYGKIW